MFAKFSGVPVEKIEALQKLLEAPGFRATFKTCWGQDPKTEVVHWAKLISVSSKDGGDYKVEIEFTLSHKVVNPIVMGRPGTGDADREIELIGTHVALPSFNVLETIYITLGVYSADGIMPKP